MEKITPRLKIVLVFLFLSFSAITLSSTENKTSADINVSADATAVSCIGGANGAIDITVSGGSGNYTYAWSGPGSFSSSSKDISNLSAGTYYLSVTDETTPEPLEENISVTISEEDNTNPTISAPSNITVSSNSGSCSASNVDLGNPVTSDNCNIEAITNNAPTFFSLGTTTVTWTVTDTAGNTATDTQEVTVRDSEKPVISAGSDIVVNNESGSCYATILIVAASAKDNCAVLDPTGTRDDGQNLNEEFPVGTTIITWEVTDDNGNAATPVQQKVTVKDSEAPELPVVNDVIWGCDYTVAPPKAVDNCSGEITGTNTNATTFSSAGNYNITWSFTDEAGNTSNITQKITIDPLEVTVSTTAADCFNATTGMAEATAKGGVAPYKYSWTGLGTGASRTNLSAGNYTITVTDANGCSVDKTVTISQPDELLMAAPNTTPVSCNGGGNGTITAGAVSGGNSGYQYSIDGTNFKSSNSFSNLSAGTYTITVKDAKNCQIQRSVTITEPENLTIATPNTTPVSCNGGGDGTISAGSVSGGNSGYQYSIDGTNFKSSNSFSNLSAGTYNFTVRDAKNCQIQQTVTITEPPLLEISPGEFSPVTCNGSADGSFTAGNTTGGTGNYQYMITGRDYQTSGTFTGLAPGSYTVTVKDINGCTAGENFVVTEPGELNMTAPTSTETTCFGAANGTVTAGDVTGGTGIYQYSIDNINFSTGNTFTGLSAGNYTIFVKDDENCALQSAVSVTEPNVLNAELSKTDVGCFDGASGTISVTNPSGGHGNYEYSIDGNTWQSEGRFEGLAKGSYSIFIRDKDYPDCEKTLNSNYEILQPAAPLTVTGTFTRTTTYGTATATATASPTGGSTGYTYEWYRYGEDQLLQNTQKATNLPAGRYVVRVTDRNGCTASAEITILEKIEAPIIPTSICENEEDMIRTSYFEVEDGTAKGGVGPYTYEWNFGADASPTTATGPGSHRVTYSSPGNKTITLNVTDSEGFTLQTTYIQYVGECYVDDCGSNDFRGSDFFVGDENGNRITAANCGSTTAKFVYVDLSTAPRRYSLYIEFIYTLEKTDGTSVTVKDGGEFYCKQTIPDRARTIRLNTWECGDIINIDNVYLTFGNNKKWSCGQGPDPKCFSTNDGETISTPLYATVTANQIPCYGGKQGILNIRASGGTPAYDYSLTGASGPFQNSKEYTGLAAGTYTVWVRDSKGDIFETSPVTIVQPDTPLTAEITTNEPVCFGENATAYATPSGGTPFIDSEGNPYYEYLWNDTAQQTGTSATNLEPGSYTVTVSDANGCQFLDTVEISEPSQLTRPSAGEDQIMGCGFNTITLEANTPEIGVGTWEIIEGDGGSITDPSKPDSEFSGTSGSYLLRWTIAHEDGNCANFDEVQITLESDCSTLDFDGVDDYIDFQDNYSLSSGNFTLEAWVKPKSVQGIKTVLSKRNVNNLSSGGYDLIINNGAPTFRWAGNAVSTSYKVGTDRWYHLAVIFKDSKYSLYVDGIPVGNRSGVNPASLPAPFFIGAGHDADNAGTPKNYFHGSIEEVRIWKSALNEEQLRFMMNQRLEINGSYTRGKAIPLDVPSNLLWANLAGYYHLVVDETENGFTIDNSSTPVNGRLKNITTEQENTAPLPYFSVQDGAWRTDETWARPTVWDPPNSKGINGEAINWNIARISHKITSGSQDITLLALLSEESNSTRESVISMEGDNPTESNGSLNPGTGNGLTITHYLDLDGVIDLNGESQLVQTAGSILEESGSGYILKQQQGTASSYNYNYWSSPVSPQAGNNNSGYTVAGVMKDGSSGSFGENLDFGNKHTYADGSYTTPRKISNYWINAFRARAADAYSAWEQIGSNEFLKAGEGYTMKGTSGEAAISNWQNYVFKGKPNNGQIILNIGPSQNYLIGNPYPSALSVDEFFKDNLKDISGGRNNENSFNGALYFWDHFSGKTHNLAEYVGGYGVLNLIGAVAAIATDERIDATGERSDRRPGDYIPPGQGFFINTEINPASGAEMPGDGGSVRFKNNQRIFKKEGSNSQFLKPEIRTKAEEKPKIRLDFSSPMGYNRQILLGVDSYASNGFDLGYDALLNDYNKEDMFWLINGWEYVIQGVGDINPEQVLPLGIRTEKKGNIFISINELVNVPGGTRIFIRDLSTGSYYNLQDKELALEIEPGEYYDRFELVFQKPQKPTEENTGDDESDSDEGEEPGEEAEMPGKETPVENPVEKDEIVREISADYMMSTREIIITNPSETNINEVRIYSINGKLIESFEEIPSNREIHLYITRPVSTAVYVVKIYSGENLINKKVIINSK
ncbi:LamG-like jellyroll fold domain-containing protein [Autumnicola musiva]|uniref:LamG-like jellyroll fold domain-containing protein n=1 Tax=Autumnicola musiva TaxID=3075589 RepID=A0ABU3D8I4_9FLAO|nr:LamG-like jellyroll fold domain-containing protein [Zunongwangia sp. F117]MDT0677833.1 LamG-like jellyroll fold domain-containing protein [Zunongwangia sp. F117]